MKFLLDHEGGDMDSKHVSDALHVSDEKASVEGYVVVYEGGVRRELPAEFLRSGEAL
jgi:hypothetical protein